MNTSFFEGLDPLVYPPVSDKLLIVAHPDDEALFCGGHLMLEGGWKVICVTNGDNPVRAAEFQMVMYVTHSFFEMWCYHDEMNTPLDSVSLAKDLEEVVKSKKWAKIVTHNEKGEYGHLHHIQIHQIMKSIVGDDLWTFNFESPYPLPEDVWLAKVELVGWYVSQAHICAEHLPNTRNERITRGKLLM